MMLGVDTLLAERAADGISGSIFERLPHAGDALSAGAGADRSNCRGGAVADWSPGGPDCRDCHRRLPGHHHGDRPSRLVDSRFDAPKAGDYVIREIGPAYPKAPDRGVPPPRSGQSSLAAEPTALPVAGLRGFDRVRKHYMVAAMTDAYLHAISAVL